MKQIKSIFLALVVTCVSSCSSTVSKAPNDDVGEYVFKPYNSDTGQFADFVILKKNFKAVEIRFSKNSGQISTTATGWYLYSPSGKGSEIVIGDFGHPIEGSGATMKLQNNYDLGMYYAKVR